MVSLTQIQLEEAMKPARYEAIVSQQLPLEARGSMVLDPGTTVASMAGKDKFSVPTAGPIGSLLAGGKIQFGRFRYLALCSLQPSSLMLVVVTCISALKINSRLIFLAFCVTTISCDLALHFVRLSSRQGYIHFTLGQFVVRKHLQILLIYLFIKDGDGAFFAGAVTSPPLGVSNSRPHTPAVMNVVGSSLGSHADDASDKNDLKKPNHMSSSELDMPSFPTKGQLILT